MKGHLCLLETNKKNLRRWRALLSYCFWQVVGEVMLLAGSITMGLVAYIVADVRQRKAFLDTRQSSEMRLTIEDQARQQVIYRYYRVWMLQHLFCLYDETSNALQIRML